jgi:hypothetical protein
MDEEGFRKFLKRGGRSPSATKRCLTYVAAFQEYLHSERGGRSLDEAGGDDLEAFVDWIEREPKASAKTHLWAITYYYDFASDEEMRQLAAVLRGQRMERKPFALRDFRGVDPEHVERLAAAGVSNAEQMLQAGRTPDDRQALAGRAGIPLEAVLELVKLSDLARIPGVKGIRARLYVDAGVDTVEKMAGWEADALREMIVDFVERTGFDGVATLPKEAAFTVATARRLPRIVGY